MSDFEGSVLEPIAVVGMACRFPGAADIDQYWRNLRAGVESISFFSDEELLAQGVDPATLQDPKYVKARPLLDGVELFDADFFDMSPREAEITDPQHRLFLECAWQAMEHAGCNPQGGKARIGVFAGSGLNTYLVYNLLPNRELVESVGGFTLLLGNDKDFVPTRTSYKLDLKGPSVCINTACSTSLTAVQFACQSLIGYQCDLALAGGVSIQMPAGEGYFHQEGGIASGDGHCRAFDGRAQGTVGGNGVGIAVLKRYEEAKADGDRIYAVVRGAAVNNDGTRKVGFTAPSAAGQARVIAEAQALAGVHPESISYIEAHGTGTPMGDPIEIAALTKAFRLKTEAKGFCSIGSVKSNFGHLDAAAGIAGFIKTVLALHNREIPPSLHVETPNPAINWAASPFVVNTRLRPWESPDGPRRAGVSSFGIGGTNVHVVLEESPQLPASGPSRPCQLLVLSAKTPSALRQTASDLAEFLQAHAEVDLADVGFTLGVGRKAFEHRSMLVCRDRAQALEALSRFSLESSRQTSLPPPVAFVLTPWKGDGWLAQARDLYRGETAFREAIDECSRILQPLLGEDLSDWISSSGKGTDTATGSLAQPLSTPYQFSLHYALAMIWISWGIRPRALAGQGAGELAAACLAGVLSLSDGLSLACTRERPEATMGEFALQEPKIALFSSASGDWMNREQALDRPAWIAGPQASVPLDACLARLLQEPRRVVLEIGWGSQLREAEERLAPSAEDQLLLSPLSAEGASAAQSSMLRGLGRLWLAGAALDWRGLYAGEKRRSLALPTYPFERRRFWIDSPEQKRAAEAGAVNRKPCDETAGPTEPDDLHGEGKRPLDDWFLEPDERSQPLPEEPNAGPDGPVLIFQDEYGLGRRVLEQLTERGIRVATVVQGNSFSRNSPDQYALDPAQPDHYQSLAAQLGSSGCLPATILHLWSLTNQGEPAASLLNAEARLNRGFMSLLFLAQALGAQAGSAASQADSQSGRKIRIEAICNPFHPFGSDVRLYPSQAALTGAVKVIPQEYPGLSCRCIDIGRSPSSEAEVQESAQRLMRELDCEPEEDIVAWRGEERLVPDFKPVRLPRSEGQALPLRQGGVYLITGGLGGIGLSIAQQLAQHWDAKLALVSRSGLSSAQGSDESVKGGGSAVGSQGEARMQRTAGLNRLRQSGADVLVLQADAADLEQMRGAVEEVRSRFGAVHGVIHAAGVPGGGVIQRRSKKAAQGVLAPKVRGALVLDEIFSGQPLDFMVYCSSLNSVLGEFANADYCAANAFLDSLAWQRRSRGEPALSINWDSWREVGMAAEAQLPSEFKRLRAESLRQEGILPAEGVEVLARALASRRAQVLVSTHDFQPRLRRSREFTVEAIERPEPELSHKPLHPRPELATPFKPPATQAEQEAAEVFQQVLGIEKVGVLDDFFELGGDSLVAVQAISRLNRRLQAEIPVHRLYQESTIRRLLAQHDADSNAASQPIQAETPLETPASPSLRLQEGPHSAPADSATVESASNGKGLAIAVIGIAGRFPGARNLDQFWSNLRDGVESIARISPEELDESGISQEMRQNPQYVNAAPTLEGVDLFDAGFFGIPPRDAEIVAPHHRLFMECAWEALEDAAVVAQDYPGLIGVYAGAGTNFYLLNNLARNGKFIIAPGVEKDFLATNLSFRLDLKGPSVDVQTFCSTALVAVHMACRALVDGECDMALSGGASILIPNKVGYLYEPEGIFSPDGHCRAFDAKAQGTVFGSGVGVIALKRLDDALADGDRIRAVIRGSAINNDGAKKASFSAPSVEGQSAVIAKSLQTAQLSAEAIDYVEAHGTGTALGDPIEVTALTRAFRRSTERKGFCAIGSVKTNIGHLDAAAGAAGLIKTILAMEHRQIPPSLHFEEPNPEIDFSSSPFFVNAQRRDWTPRSQGDSTLPRRAGVSSFGIGGTNAHVVLEEAPVSPPASPSRPFQLITVSAKSKSALESASSRLAEHLRSKADLELPDVAYTLQTGRAHFNHRRLIVCGQRSQALELERDDSPRVRSSVLQPSQPSLAFLFSGQGSQYPEMGLGIYRTEPAFKQAMDDCALHLQASLELDLRHLIFPSQGPASEAESRLRQTRFAQPALFALEYSLARLWMSWGLRPTAMIGHSIGEYVAACLSGVFSLRDALTLVAARGRLMQGLPAGAMLAVSLPEQEACQLTDSELSLAAVNGPSSCVLSGPTPRIDQLQTRLQQEEVSCRRLLTSHAFHSHMMEPILAEFASELETVELNPARIPYLSNLTGDWIHPEEAADRSYWVRHLRSCVRFDSALERLFQDPDRVLLEVGPGRTLATLAQRHPRREARQRVLSSLRHPQDSSADEEFLMTSLGGLWLAGLDIDWKRFYAGERRLKVSLPSYPFESKRFWIKPSDRAEQPSSDAPPLRRAVEDWFYIPSWRRLPLSAASSTDEPPPGRWLLLADEYGAWKPLADRLQEEGCSLTLLRPGTDYLREAED